MIVYNGDSAQAEAFRCLRTSIFALDGAAPLQTLLVTSAEPGEGKSTVVANLAVSIAQSGRRVIAVDADLRRPSLHKIFDMSNEIGLSNVLTEAIAANDIASSLLTVLASGPRPSNPTELLGSTRMLDLLKQLMQRFDVVLLDTPSLVSAGDAAVLAPMVDAVLLVIGRGQARREAVHAACQQLVAVKARSVHLIVNRAEADGRYSHHDTG
jgi:non-specific protein-tyrosine kinase